jgi:soluble lytic murein transglycosylase-like protein
MKNEKRYDVFRGARTITFEEYNRRKMYSFFYSTIKYKKYIQNASRRYHICPEILFALINIERMNRDTFGYRFFERILSMISPGLIIKKDFSIGLSQLKPSTSIEILGLQDEKTLVRNLINPEYNINICAQVLRKYLSDGRFKDKAFDERIHGVVELYLAGEINYTIQPSVELYNKLLLWSVQQKFFKRFMDRNAT